VIEVVFDCRNRYNHVEPSAQIRAPHRKGGASRSMIRAQLPYTMRLPHGGLDCEMESSTTLMDVSMRFRNLSIISIRMQEKETVIIEEVLHNGHTV
jgi:hypothetical protein